MAAEIARVPATLESKFKVAARATPSPSRLFMLVQVMWGVPSLLRRQASRAEWCYRMRPPSDGDGLARLISASAAFVARPRASLPAVEHTMRRGGMLSIWTLYGT